MKSLKSSGEKAQALQIDVCWVDPHMKLTDFRLFATDMDSTFLNLETLDEMAAFVGKGDEVSRITELTMQEKNPQLRRKFNRTSQINGRSRCFGSRSSY